MNGTIVRDPKTGEPTGALKEAAGGLVEDLIPEPTAERHYALLIQALALLNRTGITAVQDAGWTPDEVARFLPLLERARAEGKLTVRTRMTVNFSPDDPATGIAEAIRLRDRYRDGAIAFGGVKGYVDGVIEAHTAAMLAPWSDDPGLGRGHPRWEQAALDRAVAAADKAGLQVWLHAIGDRGIRLALDAYEAAAKGNGPRDRRDRVEHVEAIDAADAPRFAALGAVASMQPLHANPDQNNEAVWSRNIGEERASRGFAWRLIEKSGGRVAFGSDWPVVDPGRVPRALLRGGTQDPRGKARGRLAAPARGERGQRAAPLHDRCGLGRVRGEGTGLDPRGQARGPGRSLARHPRSAPGGDPANAGTADVVRREARLARPVVRVNGAGDALEGSPAVGAGLSPSRGELPAVEISGTAERLLTEQTSASTFRPERRAPGGRRLKWRGLPGGLGGGIETSRDGCRPGRGPPGRRNSPAGAALQAPSTSTLHPRAKESRSTRTPLAGDAHARSTRLGDRDSNVTLPPGRPSPSAARRSASRITARLGSKAGLKSAERASCGGSHTMRSTMNARGRVAGGIPTKNPSGANPSRFTTSCGSPSTTRPTAASSAHLRFANWRRSLTRRSGGPPPVTVSRPCPIPRARARGSRRTSSAAPSRAKPSPKDSPAKVHTLGGNPAWSRGRERRCAASGDGVVKTSRGAVGAARQA